MTRPSESPTPAQKADSLRELRLAQALRTNLRRRKEQIKATDGPAKASTEGET